VPRPLPDLAVAFQTVVEQTVTTNMTQLVQAMGQHDEEVLQCAMMGTAAFCASLWYGAGKANNELASARAALDAAIDQFWGQMVIGAALTEPEQEGDNLSLDPSPEV